MLTNWVSYIYNSLIVVGIIIVLITIGASSISGLTGMMIGYSFIISGIFLLVGILMNNISKSHPQGGFPFLLALFYTIGPFLVIIGIILYLLFLLGSYFNTITSGQVTENYYLFMNIFVILFMIQLYTFYKGTQDNGFKETSSLNKVTGMFIYLIQTLSIITVITLGIILKYFVTDG